MGYFKCSCSAAAYSNTNQSNRFCFSFVRHSFFHRLQTMMINHLLHKDAMARTNLQPCMNEINDSSMLDSCPNRCWEEGDRGKCVQSLMAEITAQKLIKRFSTSVSHAHTLQHSLGGLVMCGHLPEGPCLGAKLVFLEEKDSPGER